MSLGIAYREYLISKPEISGYVGDRVYVSRLKQGSRLPAIVMHDSISGGSYEHLTGSDGVGTRRVQVDCISHDVTEADDLREEVRKVTAGFRGLWGSTVSVEVIGCNTAGTLSGVDDPQDGSDNPRWRRIIDFNISYIEKIGV